MAAGLDIRRERIPEFRKRFNEAAMATLQGRDLRPAMRIDAFVEFDEIRHELIADARKLEPCGMGNPKPRWGLSGISAVQKPRVLKEAHVEILLGDEKGALRAIGFNMARRPVPDGPMDIVFEARLNEYYGDPRVELHLLDFRPHADSAQENGSGG